MSAAGLASPAWRLALALALATALSRWPFRTLWLFHWDSANFALALEHFDVTRHQPHPPGYLWYVLSAALLTRLVAEANTALVIESIGLSALAVALAALLGEAWFGRRAALAAALLLASSVTFWAYGAIAFPYVALAAGGLAVALLCWRAWSGRPLWPAALAYTVAGGFRPDLLPFLLPLLLLAAWRKPAGEWGLASAIVVGGTLAWLVPTAALSGGLTSYLDAVIAQSASVNATYAVTARGAAALLANGGDLARYLGYALYATALLVPVAAAGWVAGCTPAAAGRGLFLVLWVLPAALFYLLIHVGDPGYVFTILPPLLLAIAAGWDAAWRRWPRLAGLWLALLALALAGNLALFLFWPRPLTATGLRLRDAELAARVGYAGSFDPSRAILLALDSQRHLLVYLPRHRSYWMGLGGSEGTAVEVPAGVELAVLVDDPLVTAAERLPGLQVSDLGHRWRGAVLPVYPGAHVVYTPGEPLRFEPPAGSP